MLFILYCFSISFLPSDVALGDIIPLVLLLAQFALSLAWYVLLCALTGALFWNCAALLFHLLLPIRFIVVLGFHLVSQHPRRTTVARILGTVARRTVRRFPVWANPLLALAGMGSLLVLLNDYLHHGFGVFVPGTSDGAFALRTALFIVGCMYLFVVLQHFAHAYAPRALRRRVVVTSPLFWLAPGLFALNPRSAQVHVTLLAAVVLLVCFPGGYSGLLQLSASSAGLRSEQTTVVLQKAAAYGNAFHSSEDEACTFYRVQQTGEVATVHGVTVLFHGIGKRSLLALPAFPGLRRLEIRSEDMRTVDEPLSALRDRTDYWFRIYSIAASVDLLTDRAISRGVLQLEEDENFSFVLKVVGRIVPSPSSVADSVSNGVLKCLLKDAPEDLRKGLVALSVASVRRLGAKQ
ncbi:MAG: hypothetical protein HWD57_15760 [Candidatus Accumulibacter cognatus]|uniref:Uncharacterized protein n=1 Tax=Candidatus Accumulibacter cognatus TaxID=2954383 RepID=A0A7D5NCF9_9PROT|nr:MAG: hypothetical protein HWD57_15760 [Candidatus Accumulibacter cognatus]